MNISIEQLSPVLCQGDHCLTPAFEQTMPRNCHEKLIHNPEVQRGIAYLKIKE